MSELTDLLHSTTDAEVWTREFMRLWQQDQRIDTGTMLGWFANAIEVGRDAGRRETEPRPGQPGGPEKVLDEASDIEEAVGIAIGAASMCWNPPPGDQVFDSTRARHICEELADRIEAELQKAAEGGVV